MDREAGYALLLYNGLRATASPRQALLEFLQNAYLSAEKRAKWDHETVESPGRS